MQLGDWRASAGVVLEPSPRNPSMYSATVQLPLGHKIEAKV